MMSLNSRYQTYWYDNNGNMTWRDEYSPGQTYMAFWQGYTPDNKLYIAVGYGWNAGAGQWEFNNVYSFFYYDADGQRVRKDDSNGTTAYAGSGFEQNMVSGVQRATYSFNGQVVAVRNGATTSWLHSDHLGQHHSQQTTPACRWRTARQIHPWGEVRTGGVGAITDRGFTSQRREDNIRLNDYVARFDSYIESGVMVNM